MGEHTSGTKQEPSRRDLLQALIEEMFAVAKQIHRGISPQDASLSPPQARLLFTIADTKQDGISVKELAEKTYVTPGAITQFTDALVKRDLVKRDEDPADRRIVRLKLTENGKDQLEKLRGEFIAAATRAFNSLTDDDLKQLVGLLGKVSSSPSSRQCGHLSCTEDRKRGPAK